MGGRGDLGRGPAVLVLRLALGLGGGALLLPLRPAALAPTRPGAGAALVVVLGAAAATPAVAAVTVVVTAVAGDRLGGDDDAASVAVLALLREDLDEARADPLAGHLDQAERGDLGDLVLRAVTAEALEQAAHDEVTVGLEDHVDEVDDDDAADVAQPQLTHDLLGRLDVVLRHRLLEVAPGADELAGVDVDDGHRLGAVDDERAAGGQPHLAIHRLGDLLVDAVAGEDVLLAGPALEAVGEVGRDVVDVALDLAPRVLAGDDHLREVLVEDVADDADGHVGLGVQDRRGAALLALLRLGLLADALPRGGEPLDVLGELFLARALGGRAHDDAGAVGDDLLEDGLEAGALLVGELARDAGHAALGHVHEVAAGQRDLRGEARALVADRVLRHLDEDGVAGGQRLLDAAGLAVADAVGVPVDLAGVEDGVAALADVDEGGLHARQDVLHPAEVDVAHHRRGRLARDVVLDEHVVLEDADLRALAGGAHDHDALDALATGEELGLGDDRAAAAGLAALAAALLLRLETRAALDGLRLVALLAGLADLRHGAGRVLLTLARAGAAAATTPAPARAAALGVVVLVVLGCVVGVVGATGGLVLRVLAGLVAPATTAAATAAAGATTGAIAAALAGVVGLGRVVVRGGLGLPLRVLGALVLGRAVLRLVAATTAAPAAAPGLVGLLVVVRGVGGAVVLRALRLDDGLGLVVLRAGLGRGLRGRGRAAGAAGSDGLGGLEEQTEARHAGGRLLGLVLLVVRLGVVLGGVVRDELVLDRLGGGVLGGLARRDAFFEGLVGRAGLVGRHGGTSCGTAGRHDQPR